MGKQGDRPVIGIFDGSADPQIGAMPTQWLSYFAVDDVDAAAETTRAQGGHVHRAPWNVPGVGRIAIVADPAGAVAGLITPSENEQMNG